MILYLLRLIFFSVIVIIVDDSRCVCSVHKKRGEIENILTAHRARVRSQFHL